MIYHIFKNLDGIDLPGRHLMSYITFRAGMAFVIGLLVAVFIGRWIINMLKKNQIGEIVRDLKLQGETKKKDTPTMGGVIIIISILIPCLLLGNLTNTYMILLLVSTLWLGLIGFLDDLLKLRRKNKDGIKGKYKIFGQVGLAVLVAGVMYLNPNMVTVQNREVVNVETNEIEYVEYESAPTHAPQTTIPFVKNHNFNYASLTGWMGKYAETGGWIAFLLITVFLVCATSNGANLNDGLDGMCAGISAISCVALAIMAYLGSNIIYSAYLNIMYVPGSEEMVVYIMAMIGALIGFLWYNASPAEVFMGDTGSLMLGGIISIFAILIHKELLLPLLCLLFYLEDFSVALQVWYYKKTGGKRIFKMSPLHHHFQKNAGEVDAKIQWPYKGIAEQKIVTRFWIVSIILAALTFVTLKIR